MDSLPEINESPKEAPTAESILNKPGSASVQQQQQQMEGIDSEMSQLSSPGGHQTTKRGGSSSNDLHVRPSTSSPFLPSSQDEIVLRRLRLMTKYGHTINHPSSPGSDDPENKAAMLHDKEMDVLPIPMSQKFKESKNYTSIARTEFAITRAKREACTKGHFFLSQLPKALEKDDNELAYMILAAARRQFKLGGEEKMESEVNALHVKIKVRLVICHWKGERMCF